MTTASKNSTVLAIFPEPNPDNPTGRERLTEVNRRALRRILGSRLVEEEVTRNVKSCLNKQTLRSLFGWLDGLTPERANAIATRARAVNAEIVYIEGSNYGRLAAVLKAALPDVQIVTAYHNVEARFFWGAAMHAKSARSAAVMAANYLAERAAARSSDVNVLLTEYDCTTLEQMYGAVAVTVAPLCISEPTGHVSLNLHNDGSEPSVLFVGGGFYANEQSIRWICEVLAPHLSVRINIVGHGLASIGAKLLVPSNVTIASNVERLDPWYHNALCVIAPVFDGSGMKTKIAEALMHGRPVLGSAQAFRGYESTIGEIGIVCEEVNDYVRAIASLHAGNRVYNPSTLRSIYQECFSLDARARYYDAILSRL